MTINAMKAFRISNAKGSSFSKICWKNSYVTVFWVSRAVVLIDYLDKGVVISIIRKMREKIVKNLCEMVSNG